MFFNKLLTFIVLIFMVSMVVAEVNLVTVTFNQPERFTDFKTKANLSKKDRERLMTQLEELISTSVEKHLKNNQRMEIVFNNIDMAGTFLYARSDLFRVVKEHDRVRLDFSFQLLDAQNNLIKEGDVNLASMYNNPRKWNQRKYQHSYFPNEMPLFDKWLNDNF